MATSCCFLLFALIFLVIVPHTWTVSLHLRFNDVQKRSLDQEDPPITDVQDKNINTDKVQVTFSQSFIVNNLIGDASSNLTESDIPQNNGNSEQRLSTQRIDEFNDTVTINSITSISYRTETSQIAVSDAYASIVNHDDNSSKDILSPAFSTLDRETMNSIESITFMPHNSTSINQSYAWDLLFNDKTDVIPFNDSSTIEMNSESTTDANITYQDVYAVHIGQPIIVENNENMNETLMSSATAMNTSACDVLCPNGFTALNDTCHCNLPCQNYSCFGDDECVVTKQNKPLCQRRNGIEYDRPNHCYQPRNAGYHDVRIQYHSRWYYNPDQKACNLFIYRGLGGNENNFRTLHACNIECIICATVREPGECLSQFNIRYYDEVKHRCALLDNSSCKGNDNQFLDKKSCIDTCISRIFNIK